MGETDDTIGETNDTIVCILAWIMLAFCGLGIIGNGVSFYIFRRPSMKSSINALFAGLSMIDLVMMLLAIPTFVLVPLSGTCKPELQFLLPYIVICIYPCVLTVQTCSVWTFIVITVERWIAVCHPLQANRMCTVGNSKRALTVVCVLSVLYNAPRWLEFRLVIETNQTLSIEEMLKADSSYYLIYYTLLFIITHFVIPFAVLSSVNVRIIKSVFESPPGVQTALIRRSRRKEQKASVMMAVIVLVFLVCYSLPFVINIIVMFNPNFFKSEETAFLAFILNDVCNLLVIVNASTTFIIYYTFSKKYRTVMYRQFSRRRSTRSEISQLGLFLSNLVSKSQHIDNDPKNLSSH